MVLLGGGALVSGVVFAFQFRTGEVAGVLGSAGDGLGAIYPTLLLTAATIVSVYLTVARVAGDHEGGWATIILARGVSRAAYVGVHLASMWATGLALYLVGFASFQAASNGLMGGFHEWGTSGLRAAGLIGAFTGFAAVISLLARRTARAFFWVGLLSVSPMIAQVSVAITVAPDQVSTGTAWLIMGLVPPIALPGWTPSTTHTTVYLVVVFSLALATANRRFARYA